MKRQRLRINGLIFPSAEISTFFKTNSKELHLHLFKDIQFINYYTSTYFYISFMPVGHFSAWQVQKKSVETDLDETKAIKKIMLLSSIGFAHFDHPNI